MFFWFFPSPKKLVGETEDKMDSGKKDTVSGKTKKNMAGGQNGFGKKRNRLRENKKKYGRVTKWIREKKIPSQGKQKKNMAGSKKKI